MIPAREAVIWENLQETGREVLMVQEVPQEVAGPVNIQTHIQAHIQEAHHHLKKENQILHSPHPAGCFRPKL